MQKKLMAVAVAGALAIPAAALAQSSVTITGNLKASFANTHISNRGGAAGSSSETRVEDESSRIIFKMREDLGGGLAAIGQYDMRYTVDTGAAGGASGNTFVGLSSKSWGTIVLGRRDLHYYNRESNLTGNGSLKADSISILSYINGAPVAVTSRTTNVVHYTSPNWSGFNVIVAYSTNPFAVEADLGSAVRKGRAWNLQPNYKGKNFQIGYSYWSSKSDLGAAADQRGDRLYGSINFAGGWHVGLAWDKSRFNAAGGGAKTAERTAWSIPVEYKWGKHAVMAHFDKARDDKVSAAQDGAKMFAISYQYSLSKRTSLAVTYAKINNDAGGTYNFFTTAGGLGSASVAVPAGGDPRILSATINHRF